MPCLLRHGVSQRTRPLARRPKHPRSRPAYGKSPAAGHGASRTTPCLCRPVLQRGQPRLQRYTECEADIPSLPLADPERSDKPTRPHHPYAIQSAARTPGPGSLDPMNLGASSDEPCYPRRMPLPGIRLSLIASLALACARPPSPFSPAEFPPVTPERGAIQGGVYDLKTGKRIASALVILQCRCLPGPRETETDARNLQLRRPAPRDIHDPGAVQARQRVQDIGALGCVSRHHIVCNRPRTAGGSGGLGLVSPTPTFTRRTGALTFDRERVESLCRRAPYSALPSRRSQAETAPPLRWHIGEYRH